MSGEKKVFPVLAQLYKAAAQPRSWNEALHSTALMLNASAATLIGFHHDKSVAFSFTPGLPSAMADELPKCVAIDVRLAALRAAGPMKVCTDSDHISEEEMLRNPYYAKFLSRYGHGYYAGTVLSSDTKRETVFCVLRSRKEGPFKKPDIDLLSLIVPHVRQALEIGFKTEALEKEIALDRTVLQRINVGVIALRVDGKVLFTNRSALRIGKENDGLSLTKEGLKAHRASDDQRLQRLIAKTLEATSGDRAVVDGHGELISRPSGRKAYAVSIFPWDSPTSTVLGVHGKVLILVRDPSATPVHSEQQIAALIGLTPAEARLARHMLDGVTLQTAAQLIGVSVNTARTQLRSVFRKTDTRRQADLVRVLTLALGTASR